MIKFDKWLEENANRTVINPAMQDASPKNNRYISGPRPTSSYNSNYYDQLDVSPSERERTINADKERIALVRKKKEEEKQLGIRPEELHRFRNYKQIYNLLSHVDKKNRTFRKILNYLPSKIKENSLKTLNYIHPRDDVKMKNLEDKIMLIGELFLENEMYINKILYKLGIDLNKSLRKKMNTNFGNANIVKECNLLLEDIQMSEEGQKYFGNYSNLEKIVDRISSESLDIHDNLNKYKDLVKENPYNPETDPENIQSLRKYD